MRAETTVLMTVYNGLPYLPEALDSILNQTHPDFEFFIIDDCSTDGSYDSIASIKDPRIRLIRNDRNIGQTKSLNKGLLLASGKYIARMDQDDIALPERLEKQISFLKKKPDVALLGTWWEIISAGGEHIRYRQCPVEHVEILDSFAIRNPFGHPCVVYHRDAVLAVGGYPEDYIFAQDRVLWMLLAKRYRVANIPSVLVKVRCHAKRVSESSQYASLRTQEKLRFFQLVKSELPISVSCRRTFQKKMMKAYIAHAESLAAENRHFEFLSLLGRLCLEREYPRLWMKNLLAAVRVWGRMWPRR
jgi:glycosyltransferase involved in cell wall biosynthesis